jgi:transposase
MRVARPVILNTEQRQVLEQRARARSLPARLVERSRIVLLAADGKQDLEIAAALKITPSITGRMVQQVIRWTTQEKPVNATHWSTRTMAAASGISQTSVRRIWRAHGLKPHLVETFKISNDPEFIEKLEAIVGLYLHPPEHAIVLSVDEKSQIQALDRTQPGLPLKRGRGTTLTHDYKRNGTTTLFAALNTLDGKVISLCQERHRHKEWLRFLRLIDDATPPEKQIHLIADNYATHKHPRVQRWLARHPRFHIYFTPTSSSWLNMVERFFRDLTHNRLRRGVFRDVEELITAIDQYVDRHNEGPKPFIWTASASDILEKVKRARKALLKGQSA